MDCCRPARRLGGEDVKVVVRSERAKMKASPWEIDDAMAEDIPIINNHVPKEFVRENGKLTGVRFTVVDVVYDEGGSGSLSPTGEEVFFEADDVIIAIGQDNAFPWIERDIGLEFGKWDMPVIDPVTFQSTNPRRSSAEMPPLGQKTSLPPSPTGTRPLFPWIALSAARMFMTARPWRHPREPKDGGP